MNNSDPKHLLKWNSALWIAAMIMPAFFSIALGDAKFPWPIVIPFLFFGLMLGSNRMLYQAISAGAARQDSHHPLA